MRSAMILALLLPAQPPGTMLTARLGRDDKPSFAYASVFTVEKVGQDRRTLTTTVSSYITTARMLFVLPTEEEGSIQAASAKNGEVVPRHLTMVRSTYRPIRQAVDSVAGKAGAALTQFAITAASWSEADGAVPAFPGGKLEAKLLDGDGRGKELVRITSEITGNKDKGYTYHYKFENLSDRTVRFQWEGLEDKLAPKKSYIKEEASTKLTEERSGIVVIDFKNGEVPIQLKANFWARPK